MPPIINFNKCDNSPECDAVKVCPVKAISYDQKKQKIVIDKDKCINCGLCVNTCQAGALKMVSNEDYEDSQKQIEKEVDKTKELFVERYGAEPIDENMLKTEEEFSQILKENKGIIFEEIFDDNSIKCLIKSIPISLLIDKNTKYFKVQTNKNLENLPFLNIYEDGNLKGTIQGFYGLKEKDEFIEKINKILNE